MALKLTPQFSSIITSSADYLSADGWRQTVTQASFRFKSVLSSELECFLSSKLLNSFFCKQFVDLETHRGMNAVYLRSDLRSERTGIYTSGLHLAVGLWFELALPINLSNYNK